MAQIKTEPLTDFYEVKEELGRGRFAVVKRCIKITTGEAFAAKCIRKARAGRRGREQLLLEIDILYQSDHPKLVNLYDVFETRTEIILILEYAAGGDLHKHCLEQVETVRTEKEICFLIYQIIEAALYLHQNHVVHLDLKPENILLIKTDERFPEIRLIDFGLSRRMDVPYSQYDIVGTPEYVAPEVLDYEPIGLFSDLWSIGVVTYVLLSGISPFAGDDIMETYGNISNVDFDFDAEEFDDISDEAKDFIECLLIKDPKERLTSKECLEHPWLSPLEQGVDQNDIDAAIQAETTFSMLSMQESDSETEEIDEDSVFPAKGEVEEKTGNEVSSKPPCEQVNDEVKGHEVAQVLSEVKEQEAPEVEAEVKEQEAPEIEAEVKEQEAPEIEAEVKEQEAPEVETGVKGQETPEARIEIEDQVKNMVKEEMREGFKNGKVEETKSEDEVSVKTEKLIETKSMNLFDIDSLICNEEVAKETEEIICKTDVENKSETVSANLDQVVSLESTETVHKDLNGMQSNHEMNNGVLSSEVVSIAEKNTLNAAKDEGRGTEKSCKSTDAFLTPSGSSEIVYKKQRSADEPSAKSKSDNFDKRDARASLVKMKSVDDGLLSGRKKSNDVGKGKLGAHLEKLSKAGLNFSSENDVRKLGPTVLRQGSTKRQDSGEKISLDISPYSSTKDVSRGELHRQDSCHSSKSSGSSSGRETPESDRGTSISAASFSPANSRSATSKQSTPTEEKVVYSKRPPVVNLGVRQGIAAQMASKFANPENKDNSSTKLNKSPFPQSKVSNRKVFDTKSSEGKTQETVPSRSPQLAQKFENAHKFATSTAEAKNEVPKKLAATADVKVGKLKDSPKFERATKVADVQKPIAVTDTRRDSSKSSPKFDRPTKVADAKLKIKNAEENLKLTSDAEKTLKVSKTTQNEPRRASAGKEPESQVDGRSSAGKEPESQVDGRSSAGKEPESQVNGAIKKVNAKDNIIQKLERQIKAESDPKSCSVNIQPKGLQINFNLQPCNKFKTQDQNVPVGREIAIERDVNYNRREVKVPVGKGTKPITFNIGGANCIEVVTVPSSFSTVSDQEQEIKHVEHTAIGAIATMPRASMRELRSKSRTSRDRGDGSPSSPRKSYRRLYVTHVKGSKSEQEAELPEDIAEFKTKVEKDELKVELLVKFPGIKFGTL